VHQVEGAAPLRPVEGADHGLGHVQPQRLDGARLQGRRDPARDDVRAAGVVEEQRVGRVPARPELGVRQEREAVLVVRHQPGLLAVQPGAQHRAEAPQLRVVGVGILADRPRGEVRAGLARCRHT
jgi:hypothetical protein